MDASREAVRRALRESAAAIKQQDFPTAMAVLAPQLRNFNIAPDQFDRAGRLVRKGLTQHDAELHIRVLGQVTTTWLGNALAAESLARGTIVEVLEGDYDNVMQEAHEPARSDVTILLPWNTRVLSGHEDAIRFETEFWQQVWATLADRGDSRIVQIGYDWTHVGPQGGLRAGEAGGSLGVIRKLNDTLRSLLPDNACFVDLGAIAGDFGRRHFYDARRFHWTRQPFSEAGTVELSRALWAAVRAITTGPKKVLVLDLDNTLWGGVVAEEGAHGITLGGDAAGEAYQAFQQYCKAVNEQGVILAVASKNNDADAREPFVVNPQMRLKLENIAVFEANWNPKNVSLEYIAKHLNISLDSMVFFDDNEVERALIQSILPQVEVVPVPDDPAGYVQALAAGRWFDSVQLTGEDRDRKLQYQQQAQRSASRHDAATLDDYLLSLHTIGDARDLTDVDLERVIQLMGKTNQFNLTTVRHQRAAVERMMATEGRILRTLRLSDRFGDSGLISVLLALPVPAAEIATLQIDTWLMSCRVIGRTAEAYFFNDLCQRARTLGYRQLRARYVPTAKNALVKTLLPDLGFRQDDSDSDSDYYVFDLDTMTVAPTCVADGNEAVTVQ